MPDELPKILSCPWCGSPGKLTETEYNWRVICRRTFDCAAVGPVRDTRTEAILIWNRPERSDSSGISDKVRIDQIENYGLRVEHKGSFRPDGSASEAWHPLLPGPDDPEWDNLRDALDATAPSADELAELGKYAKKVVKPPEDDPFEGEDVCDGVGGVEDA